MSSEHKALKDIVIDGYIAQGENAGGENHWSWNVVEDLIDAPPDVLWPILLELIARAPDRHLGSIAAGPVEDFLSRWGERVINAVEARAEADPRFRRVLRGVWKLGMTKEIYARVVAASRPEEGPIGVDGFRPDGEPLPSHRTDLIVLTVEGLPPGAADDVEGARSRLLEALTSVHEDVVLPFPGPVFLTFFVRLAPEDELPDPLAVMRSVIDVLVPAVFPSPTDVWNVELRTLREKASSYRVEVVQMSELQVADKTDISPLS